MSEFFIDGYRVATEAELAALERASAAGDLDCGVLISGMVAELRALRADAATHALVVKELQAKIRARLSRPSLLVEPECIHAGRFFTWLWLRTVAVGWGHPSQSRGHRASSGHVVRGAGVVRSGSIARQVCA